MIELDVFEEFELPPGEVWVGDPEEIFQGDTWCDFLDIIHENFSVKGFTCCYNGSSEFFLIDLIEPDPVVQVVDYAREPEDDTQEHYADDIEAPSGYFIIISMEDLGRLIPNKEIDHLETGVFVDLEKDAEIKVSIKGVKIGEQILIAR
jgi:hypothetical protein